MKPTNDQWQKQGIDAHEKRPAPVGPEVFVQSEIDQRVRAHQDRWTRIARCTEPADRPQAERAIALMYRAAELEPPRVAWCGSPLSQGLTRAIVQGLGVVVGDNVREEIRASHANYVTGRPGQPTTLASVLWGAVPDGLAAFADGISANVGHDSEHARRHRIVAAEADSVLSRVVTGVTGSVLSSLGDGVSPEFEYQVSASLRREFDVRWGDGVHASIADSFYGQHDAWWFVFLDYVREARRLGTVRTTRFWPETPEGYAGLELLSRSAGWVLPHRHICWVSERHNVLRHDDRGRLHCENGPAVAYPDTWSLYYWHGVSVPAEWIERRESNDPALVFTHGSLEQRRALVEIVGWPSLLARLPTRVIDQHADPMIGTLLECDLPVALGSRFLRVRCGTQRDFVLCVPPEMRTAQQANSWTYSIGESEYQLEART